jgi:hypothetical protein
MGNGFEAAPADGAAALGAKKMGFEVSHDGSCEEVVVRKVEGAGGANIAMAIGASVCGGCV